MNSIWIKNGNVVLPDRILCHGSILMTNGCITAIGQPCPAHATIIDAKEGYILPGFIDIHVHGGGRADCMDATPEAFHTLAQAHCAHGTTSLVPTTMTCADSLLENVIQAYLVAKKSPHQGAELLGLHLEGPFFSPLSKGAQPIHGFRAPTISFLEQILNFGQGHILRWDASPELPQMQLFAHVMKSNGVLCAIAHTHADATTAMHAFDWGFSHVTHFYNATTTFHKKKGIVHAGVIEATYLRDDVTIELIADGCHIPKESMQLAYAIKGADRIALITDAMRASCTDDQTSILGAKAGGVPVIIKDNVAQLMDFSSYAGSIGTMDRALRVAHVKYQLPLVEVSKMLSLTPARLCGCEKRKGSIALGKDADIVIMSPRFEVQQVFVRGVLKHHIDCDKMT